MLIKAKCKEHTIIGQLAINNVYDLVWIKHFIEDGVYHNETFKLVKNDDWIISLPSIDEKQQWSSAIKASNIDAIKTDTNIQIDLLKIA